MSQEEEGRRYTAEILLISLVGAPPGDRLHAGHLVQALLLLDVPGHRPGPAGHRLRRRLRGRVEAAEAGRAGRRSSAGAASRARPASALGYLVVALTPIDTLSIWDYGTSDSFSNLVRLVLICLALFASFVAIGVMISTLFARRSEHISRLYFADLLGAGLACAVVVFLLVDDRRRRPRSSLAGVILAGLGIRLLGRPRLRSARPSAPCSSCCSAPRSISPSVLPDIAEDAVKNDLADDDTLLLVVEPDLPGRRGRGRAPTSGSSSTTACSARPSTATTATPRASPASTTTPARSRSPCSATRADNVMIIGAAGGNEILASLYFDAEHIDAIELNPVTHDLVTDDFADYAGHLADDPNVNYVQGDGRTFLARSDDDLRPRLVPGAGQLLGHQRRQLRAPSCSPRATSTRARPSSESLDHLGDDGILAAQYGEFDYEAKPNRTARYVATARARPRGPGHRRPVRPHPRGHHARRSAPAARCRRSS